MSERRGMKERHAISIQLTTPGGSARRWTLAGAGLYAAALVVILALTAVCYLAMRNAALANVAREADRIAAKNRELEQTAQELATLQQELQEMHRVDSEIRTLLGLPATKLAEGGETAAAIDGRADLRTQLPEPDAGAEGALAIVDARIAEAAAPPLPLTPEERAILAAPDPRSRVLADESARLARLGMFAWPIEGWVSSEFGDARAGDAAHNGLDIAAPAGAAVLAAASGEIVVAGIDSLYGRVVVIDHGDGLRSVYGHNASLAVRRGDRVERGETIATVGSTGQSTAPHLHFELRRGNEMLDPRDVLPPVRDAIARNR
jgi:murein DD-endopeptidase MepM/ murein hydrolase activator NlpD